MSAEIFVNITPMETRVAVVENGAAQDIHIERQASRGIVGNIYRGRVARLLPGMQAAFVDIGLERAGFLHLSDIRGAHNGDGRITDHLREGEAVTVQVLKDPLGKKGARLTTELSVSTRYLVYMPQGSHVGVSQRIEDMEERTRLQAVLAAAVDREELAGEDAGYILRTAAEGVGEAEVGADLRYLKRLWAAVSRRSSSTQAPQLVYEDLPLHLRTVRDLARPGVQRIVIDSRENYAALSDFCEEYMPEVGDLLELYTGDRPIFDLHGIEEDLQRAMGRQVLLKSGGHLVIDQTEAMTTIDVNTGSFVGRRNQEETLFKTNLEAATALARQLRLRNLGGIIIIDFIDMQDAEHRRQVHRALEKAMSRDPARNKITGVSDLGLVEMTRKRSRESLEHTLCEECPSCGGRGVQKTAETICCEVFREILREARAWETGDLMVLASPPVIDRLLGEESQNVADLEAFIGRTIALRSEPDFGQEDFDIVLH